VSLFKFRYLTPLLMLCSSVAIAAPHIAHWTEQPGELGLGYPVPIPVNTPLPFTGFRSYNGLRARHFELALSTNVVHRQIIGTTQTGSTINAWQIGDSDLTEQKNIISKKLKNWQSDSLQRDDMVMIGLRISSN